MEAAVVGFFKKPERLELGFSPTLTESDGPLPNEQGVCADGPFDILGIDIDLVVGVKKWITPVAIRVAPEIEGLLRNVISEIQRGVGNGVLCKVNRGLNIPAPNPLALPDGKAFGKTAESADTICAENINARRITAAPIAVYGCTLNPKSPLKSHPLSNILN